MPIRMAAALPQVGVNLHLTQRAPTGSDHYLRSVVCTLMHTALTAILVCLLYCGSFFFLLGMLVVGLLAIG